MSDPLPDFIAACRVEIKRVPDAADRVVAIAPLMAELAAMAAGTRRLIDVPHHTTPCVELIRPARVASAVRRRQRTGRTDGVNLFRGTPSPLDR